MVIRSYTVTEIPQPIPPALLSYITNVSKSPLLVHLLDVPEEEFIRQKMICAVKAIALVAFGLIAYTYLNPYAAIALTVLGLAYVVISSISAFKHIKPADAKQKKLYREMVHVFTVTTYSKKGIITKKVPEYLSRESLDSIRAECTLLSTEYNSDKKMTLLPFEEQGRQNYHALFPIATELARNLDKINFKNYSFIFQKRLHEIQTLATVFLHGHLKHAKIPLDQNPYLRIDLEGKKIHVDSIAVWRDNSGQWIRNL